MIHPALVAQMTAESWVHLEIVGVVLVPIFLFWIDTRRTSHKNHTENQVRLGILETQLKPLVDWWNRRKEE